MDYLTEAQKQEIRDCVVNGELPCARAFQLSEELKVTLNDIGRFCNEEGIKVKHCQLGCFK